MNRTMQTLTMTVVLFAAAIMTGCNVNLGTQGSGNVISETRNVSGFNQVDVSGVGTLIIEQGETESLTIEGDDNILPLIVSEVRGEQLVLGTKPNTFITKITKLEYHLTVKSLNAVSVSGATKAQSASLTAETFKAEASGASNIAIEKLETSNTTLNASGASKITINALSTDKLNATGSGGSAITVTGKAESQTVRADGGSNYDAPTLISSDVTIDLNGGSRGNVTANKSLNLKASGGSLLTYGGEAELTQDVSGGSNVTKR
jgi:hypothetical protein